MVETYLTLDESERENFESLVATPEGKEVKQMISIYEERGIEKGTRKTLLRQMERKFGAIPESVRTRLELVKDIDELDRLSDIILSAKSIADMGLDAE